VVRIENMKEKEKEKEKEKKEKKLFSKREQNFDLFPF
jgi:hypothetical protein